MEDKPVYICNHNNCLHRPCTVIGKVNDREPKWCPFDKGSADFKLKTATVLRTTNASSK